MWMHQRRCFPTQERLGVNGKKDRRKTVEEFSETSRVPLEHMFNNHEMFSAEWYFKTRASE